MAIVDEAARGPAHPGGLEPSLLDPAAEAAELNAILPLRDAEQIERMLEWGKRNADDRVVRPGIPATALKDRK